MASREHLLISAFVDLADTLVDDYDVLELLDRLVGYCVELYVADTAGIMLADGRGLLHVVASTDRAGAGAGRRGAVRRELPLGPGRVGPRSGRRPATVAALRGRPARLLIEQAKGILAERGGLDVDTAFTRLRLSARTRGLRQADVARDVIEGDLAADVLAAAEGTTTARDR